MLQRLTIRLATWHQPHIKLLCLAVSLHDNTLGNDREMLLIFRDESQDAWYEFGWRARECVALLGRFILLLGLLRGWGVGEGERQFRGRND